MSTSTVVSKTVFPWLRENLGKCLGGLTGQDFPALKTAVHAVELWCSADSSGRKCAALAFRGAVEAMQPNLRYLAFHAIAHVGDWGMRHQLWEQADLEPLDWDRVPKCAYEPGGRERMTVKEWVNGHE